MCVTKKNTDETHGTKGIFLGGGNSKTFVSFHLGKLGKMKPFFDSYFSDGLKPPTSILLVRCFFWLILFLDTLWKV